MKEVSSHTSIFIFIPQFSNVCTTPEEISEDTIIPCVVGDEKGAFITKMGHGGVEFVESLYSPDSGDKGAFITKMSSEGVEVVEPGDRGKEYVGRYNGNE